METLGKRIRELRMAKGMTQSELGQGLVTPSMISQIEADKANPSYKLLEHIALRLEKPIEYFFVDLQGQLAESAKHKVAKAHMNSKSYAAAAVILESIREDLLNQEDINQIKIDLGECYILLNRFEEAISVFEGVIERCSQEGTMFELITSFYKIGIVEEARKKYYNAIYYYRKSLDVFAHLVNYAPFLHASIAISLGTLLNKMGDSAEAVHYFEIANSLLEGTNNFDLLAQTYLGLSYSHLSKNEFALAYEYANNANALFEAQSNVKLSIDVRKKLAIIKAQQTGNLSSSMVDLKECVSEYIVNNLPFDALVASGEIASLCLQEGQVIQCLEMCEQALSEFPNEAIEAAPILRTKGKALDQLGETSEAIRCLEVAIDLFQSSMELSEAAETYSIIAGIHERQGKFENATYCLQKMRHSYEESLKERGIAL